MQPRLVQRAARLCSVFRGRYGFRRRKLPRHRNLRASRDLGPPGISCQPAEEAQREEYAGSGTNRSRPRGPAGWTIAFSVHLPATHGYLLPFGTALSALLERKPFRVITDPAQRREVLLSGWKSVGKVFVLALILDAVYQFKVFRWFYPSQALLVALFLAVVPACLLLRGPVNWLTPRRNDGRKKTDTSVHLG